MGLLGAIVGGVIGGVVAFETWDVDAVYYGWTIGAAIGSAVEASTQKIRAKGATLNDLTINVSTYGGMVPINFGTVPLIGLPIDLDKITPHSKESSSSGKGGSKTVTTTTTYTTSVAIMFGEGVCFGIKKLWIDGKLRYSIAEDADFQTIIASSMSSGLFKFYQGTETQLPDPTLEAMHGVGNVSAYRGIAYVVFTDQAEILNGNQLRQLTFELMYSGNLSIVHHNWNKGPMETTLTYAECGVQSFIPSYGDEILLMRQVANPPVSGFASFYEVWSILPTAQRLIRHIELLDMAYSYGATAGSADEFGHLRPWVSNPEYVFQGIYRWIYPDLTLDRELVVPRFINFHTGLDFCAFNPLNALAFSKQGRHMLLLGAHAATPTTFVQVKLFLMVLESHPIASHDFTPDLAANEVIMAVVLASSCAWVISENQTAGTSILRKCSLLDLSTIATVTYRANDAIPGGTGETYGFLFHGIGGVCLGGDDFYVRNRIGNAPYGHFILKVDQNGVISIEGSDGLVLATPAGGGIGSDILAGGGSNVGAQVDLVGSSFGYNPSTRVATIMCKENLEPNNYLWPYTVSLRTVRSTPPIVGDAVSKICQRRGYTPDQLDVSELIDTFLGYSIASIGSARSAIEPFLKYSYADSVDSDGKTKFVKRGGPPLFTIPYDDLCAHEEGQQIPEPFAFTRIDEVSLPSKVNVNFKNPLADYQASSESSPQRSTTSQNPLVEDMPIIMLPQKAAELASVLYFDQIIQRMPRSFAVEKWKYDALEPTDPGYVEWPKGTFNPIRIVKREENGPVLKFDCVPEDADAYTPNARASSSVSGQTGITLIVPSILTLLDIPILRDSDNDAGLYAVVAGSSGTGTNLLRSSDDSNYTDLGFIDSSGITGFATSTLGNWTGGNVFDEMNTVDVAVNGVLTSATESAILADATLNAYVLGIQGSEEVGQFKTATQLSASKCRLSGLRRGLLGTEWATGLHTATDQFVLLGVSGTTRPNEGATAIGSPRFYRAVSVGRTLAQTYGQQFINTGVGLKPFSPVNMTWGVNAAGDYMIYAQRRSRLQARQGMFWDLPLGETSEAYRVKIYSDAGYTTLKRTIDATTFPIMYTTAMQTADFGAVATSYFVRLCQISATVGEGYALSAAVSNIPFRGSWNPDDKLANAGAQVLLSNQNSTGLKSGAGLAATIRAGQSAGTGKRYFELAIDAAPSTNSMNIGVCSGNSTLFADMSSANNSSARVLMINPQGTWNYWNGSGNSGANIAAAAFSAGNVVAFAIDFAAGKAWFLKNGTSVQGDPVAGTSPVWTFTAGTVLFPFFNALSTQDLQQVSIRLSAYSQAYAAPSGYSAYLP